PCSPRSRGPSPARSPACPARCCHRRSPARSRRPCRAVSGSRPSAGRRPAARCRSPARPPVPRCSASARRAGTSAPPLPSLAERVAYEPAYHDVLARLGRGLLHQLAHRLLAGRVLHEDLVHQRAFLVELLDLALDDLVPHRLRLALVLHLLTV